MTPLRSLTSRYSSSSHARDISWVLAPLQVADVIAWVVWRPRPPRVSRTDTARRVKGTRQLVGLSAAAYADVSTRTLRRYIAQGRLTGYRVGPRLVKVDLSELDQLARPIPTARGPC
jgi:excisionase family DNA binding protein